MTNASAPNSLKINGVGLVSQLNQSAASTLQLVSLPSPCLVIFIRVFPCDRMESICPDVVLPVSSFFSPLSEQFGLITVYWTRGPYWPSTCFIFSGLNCSTTVSPASSLMYLDSDFHNSLFDSRFFLAASLISVDWAVVIFLFHLLFY